MVEHHFGFRLNNSMASESFTPSAFYGPSLPWIA